MSRPLIALVLACCGFNVCSAAESPTSTRPGHYLIVWAGDKAGKDNDFLAVVNADPASSAYGRLVTTLATDQQTVRVHHTEYTMPASGMLFANDHDVGRTFILDVRNPLQPKIVTSFKDMAGYMTPIRLRAFPMATCWRRSSTLTMPRKVRRASQADWWKSMTPAK